LSRIRKSLPLLALAILAGQLSATASDLPASRGSANLQLVAQIPGAGGTDLEFFSRELRLWKDADGNEHVVPAEEPAVTRHFAFVGNQASGARIVDITNPEAPFVAFHFTTCKPSQGDVQIAPGGMVATLAKQGGTCTLESGANAQHGSIIIDMTDVYAPQAVAVARDTRGAHNNTIHPSGDYVYISSSGDTPNHVPIYDISDPTKPTLVKNLAFESGDSPHDIRFSEDGTRAYLAGIDQFRILDTTDPENPTLISQFIVPGSTVGHDALVTHDKSFLFAGDELQGGNGPSPCPGGAVYVYDIRGENEKNPVLLGVVEAGSGPVSGRNNDEAAVEPLNTDAGCTSHVMDMNPDKRSFTIGWYQSGLRTFDFSALYNADGTPKLQPSLAWGAHGVGVKETGWIVPEGADTWAAKQYARVPGYIFADDLVHGLYVVKIK
jgi:hypothetical protein